MEEARERQREAAQLEKVVRERRQKDLELTMQKVTLAQNANAAGHDFPIGDLKKAISLETMYC